MNTNDSNILVKPADAVSLKAAIELYIQRIEAEDLGVGGEMSHCFMKEEGDKQVYLSNLDVLNRELMVQLLSVWEMLGFDDYRGEDEEPLFSEMLVAVNALQFPELKECMVKWAEAIVKISRKYNDTSDLWIDDMHVFGLDVLYAIALTYPEYMYFIGLYLIPYWDDEHAPYAFEYLPMLQSQFGFSRDLLKALAFCDNGYAVYQIAVDEDYMTNQVEKHLYKHFVSHPEDYSYFVECLIEKFRLYPVEAESEDGEHVAESLIRSIVPDMSQDDWENKFFITDTFENQVADLTNQINHVLRDVPKSDYCFREDDDDRDLGQIRNHRQDDKTLKRWDAFRELCEKGFDNGAQVWAYVLEGAQPEVLDSIAHFNLRELANQRELSLCRVYHVYDEDDWDWFVSYYVEALQLHLPKFMAGQKVLCESEVNDVILRGLDVLFRLRGKRSFSDEIKSDLIEVYELLNKEAFDKRFKGNRDAEIKEALGRYLKEKRSRKLNREKLEEIYQLYKEKPIFLEELLEGVEVSDDSTVLNVVTQLSEAKTSRVLASSNQLMIVAYICWREKAYRTESATAPLVSFFTDSFWQRFLYEMIDKYRLFDKQVKSSYLKVLKDLYDYGLALCPAEGQKEAILKMVNDGPGSLSDDELRLIHQKPKPTKSKMEINESLQAYYYKDNTSLNQSIPEIELFDFRHMDALLSAAMFAFRALPHGMESTLIRAFHVVLDLAPVKTLHTVSKFYFTDPDTFSIKDYQDLLERFEQMQVPESYIKAWQIVYLQKQFEWDKSLVWDEYTRLLALYHTRDTVDEQQAEIHIAVEKREKAGVHDVMSYLDHNNRRLFIEKLNEEYPEQVYAEFLCEAFLDDLEQMVGQVVRKEGLGRWHYNTDAEKQAHTEFVKEMMVHLKSFIFQDGSFEPIETGLLPYLDDYIPSDIDTSMWYLPETYRNRVLYLQGRMENMDGIYEYWSCWEEKQGGKLLHDMFELIVEIGLGESFALRFLLENFPDDYLKSRGRDEFVKQFQRVYDRSSVMIDNYQNMQPALVVKAVRWMGTDLINSPYLFQFFAHRSRKVRDEAINQLLKMPHISLGFRNPFMIEFFENHPGKAREWFWVYLQRVRADFPADKVAVHCDAWQKELDAMG